MTAQILRKLLHKMLLLGLLVFTHPQVIAQSGDKALDNWRSDYDALFKKYSARFFGPHFDWRWFKAQAIVESSLNHRAMSSSGAVGLMQLLPTTYGDISKKLRYVGDLEVPQWNIAAGIFYNKGLYRRWNGVSSQDRLYLTLASYNAGFYRIYRAYKRVKGPRKHWKDIKKYIPSETRLYVERIRALMNDSEQRLRVAQLSQYLSE